MIVILCIDERGGMLFNKRRLSSDKIIMKRIIEHAAKSALRMAPYSAPLFSGVPILVEEDFLVRAEAGDFCFVENKDLSLYSEKIEKWIIYRWNRKYPSDFKFDFSLLEEKELIHSIDFEGASHMRITEEIYL